MALPIKQLPNMGCTFQNKKTTLRSVLIAQDFLPEHWNWANTDLATLGDIEKMGNVIKTRLENGGCKISGMYAVKHDKDESKLWNEYTMTYDVKFTTNHAHFLIKFSEGKRLKKLLISLVKNILNITEKDMKLGRVAELNEKYFELLKGRNCKM